MGSYKVKKEFFFAIVFLVSLSSFFVCCNPSTETLKPETIYIKSFVGTYSGFLFPKESIIIGSVSPKRSNAVYYKDSLNYYFEFDYDYGIFDTLGFYKTEIQYFGIVSQDSIMSNFKGGKKDFDTLRVGLQNLKLSKTSVFGSNISIQFSGIINDTIAIDRSFQKK